MADAFPTDYYIPRAQRLLGVAPEVAQRRLVPSSKTWTLAAAQAAIAAGDPPVVSVPYAPELRTLRLTQAEYDALAVKDPGVLYVVVG